MAASLFAASGALDRAIADVAPRLLSGNSGGPLADARGRVVGIDTLVDRGMGVAVPAERVAALLASAG